MILSQINIHTTVNAATEQNIKLNNSNSVNFDIA